MQDISIDLEWCPAYISSILMWHPQPFCELTIGEEVNAETARNSKRRKAGTGIMVDFLSTFTTASAI